tara:strand:+ start:147 stop:875 length:729 start_codon:yes stop_codon:yes gene_type:complete
MSKIRLHGTSSGYTEIAPVAASGNNTLTLPNDGTLISKDANGAVGITSVYASSNVTVSDTITLENGSAKVGSGITLTTTGDVFFTGVSTGNGSGLTGINTPSFSAKVSGTAQTLSTGSEVAIIFNSEDHDTDDAYNTSTGEFTVPAGKGGIYFIAVNFGIDDMGEDGDILRLRVFKNGSLLSGFRGQNVASANDFILTTSVSGSETLAAGDVIKCMAYTTHNVGDALIEVDCTHFSMFRLAI